jgi:hypothetical protein
MAFRLFLDFAWRNFQDWRRCRYRSLTNPLKEPVKITVYSEGEI